MIDGVAPPKLTKPEDKILPLFIIDPLFGRERKLFIGIVIVPLFVKFIPLTIISPVTVVPLANVLAE